MDTAKLRDEIKCEMKFKMKCDIVIGLSVRIHHELANPVAVVCGDDKEVNIGIG